MNLVYLQFKTVVDFETNLSKLISLIKTTPKNSFIVAPELALNGYAYDRLEEAVNISNKAIEVLKTLSIDKTITLTLTTKQNNKYLNTLHIFHKGNIIHTQSKVKLFELGDEQKYYSKGDIEDIKIIDIEGIKVGAIICFEIRFIEFWEKLKGADIILIPSMWGEPRKENFETLTQSLAVMNQCFVCAANSANDDMASSSGIITPFGKEFRDDSVEILSQKIDFKEIKKMRRYLDIGLK